MLVHKNITRFIGQAVLIGLLVCPSFGAALSPTVPLDSWVYPAVDKVTALCFVEHHLKGLRPYSRAYVADMVRRAERNYRIYEVPRSAGILLARLKQEFQSDLQKDRGNGTAGFEMFGYGAGLTLADGLSLTNQGVGMQFPLSYNDRGAQTEDNRVYGDFTAAASWRNHLLVAAPEFSLTESQSGDIVFPQLTASTMLGDVELLIGAHELWWGQGHHGSLILTNNFEPLTMLRVTNPSPAELPWFLNLLGPFRFDLFVSRLEASRTVPEPYFGGVRFDFRPHETFELGVARTVIFGGEGRPDIGISDFLTILAGENLGASDDTSNSIAGIDFRVYMPFFQGLEVYGELAGEDQANYFFSKNAFLAGAHLPNLGPEGRISIRLEYMDSHTAAGGTVWYRHSVYESGYTHQGRIMGHHAGGDARDLYAAVTALLTDDFQLTVECDFEERGVKLALPEKHIQPGLHGEWWLADGWRMAGRLRYDKVSNLNNTDTDEDMVMGEISVDKAW